jgi:hypothetical protein
MVEGSANMTPCLDSADSNTRPTVTGGNIAEPFTPAAIPGAFPESAGEDTVPWHVFTHVLAGVVGAAACLIGTLLWNRL